MEQRGSESKRFLTAVILASQDCRRRLPLDPMNFSDSGKGKRTDNCSSISHPFVIFANGRRSGQCGIGVCHTQPCGKRHWLNQTRVSQ
ncbi:hypothetical protein Y1Q_0012315 [Alligator mississippiensis]|uniref:Uncharacterized protein n=1 Tax=Alligator mississippiensis TaxID=8496 RepID=A0A151MMA7_ALLMI|nr:hypothetical protein Y1Q_0012315 [Alligator mississippiensis]